MALTPNKTTGRAVADIKSVYFRKYAEGVGEPTINKALLEEANTWFPVATIRGSVNISQDQVSVEKINIDQSNMPIGITTEPGDFTFEATLASMASIDLARWLDDSPVRLDGIKGSDGTTTYDGAGYDIKGEVAELSVFIETRTGDAFIFPRVQISAAVNKDDKVFGLVVSGQVLASTNAANKAIYILADHSAEDKVSVGA